MILNKRDLFFAGLLKKISKIYVFALAAASLAIMSSCNEQPTSVGYSLLYDTVNIQTLSSTNKPIYQGAQSYYQPLSIINIGKNLVGKSGDYEAVTIYRFGLTTIPDSALDLTESDIIATKLHIQPSHYAFGDTSEGSSLSFGVYPVLMHYGLGATWDSIAKPGFFSSRRLGEFEGSIIRSDTLINEIMIDLDNSYFMDMLYRRLDSALFFENLGVGLVPDAGKCDFVQQFEASLFGQPEKENSYLEILYSKVEGRVDTLRMYSMNDMTYIKPLEYDPEQIMIQNGASMRTWLYFDVGEIPKFAAVHYAELILSVDESKTQIGNFGYDQGAYAVYYLDTNDLDSPSNRVYRGYFHDQEMTYRFPTLAPAVEIWARRGEPGTLSLTSLFESQNDYLDEYTQIDKIAFRGADDPDPSKRPRLRIIYSEREDIPD